LGGLFQDDIAVSKNGKREQSAGAKRPRL